MRVRLKQFATVLDNKDTIIVAGAKNRTLLIKKTPKAIRILDQIKEGVNADKDILDDPTFIKLADNGLIEQTSKNPESVRRNHLFYDYVGYNFESLTDKRIIVLGAGAAGGTITYLLAQQGFEHILCIDYDIVNQSDVNKTLIFDASDIGKSKVDSLKKRINNNFGINIHTRKKQITGVKHFEEIVDSFNPDIIVYAIDPRPRLKLELDILCVKRGIKIIHSAYSYEKLICGPCVIPHETACYVAYNEFWRQKTNGLFDYNNIERLYPDKTIHPSISFIINGLASIIVKDIIFCLGDLFEYVTTLNKLVTIDILTGEIEESELTCSICNKCITEP